jgi:N-acetylglucosaminyldiphosphoundecaprenol N-acetyl-beta-D-mannosaminyltransferase
MLHALGLEWLWRIKEEPHLWERYWRDARTLLRLLCWRVLPLACGAARHRWRRAQQLSVCTLTDAESVVLTLAGDATSATVAHATAVFQQALLGAQSLFVLDLAAVRYVDQRFLGSLLMLRKCLHQGGGQLLFVTPSRRVRRLFELNEVAFLLKDE